MPRVSVIVPARDAAGTLPRTLDALAAQDLGEPYEVLVVDDGSSDGTPDLARAAPGAVGCSSRRRRPGRRAQPRGRALHGAVLAFCDADVFPTPGWLRAGVAALKEADLVQGHVLPDPSGDLGPFDRTPVDHARGRALPDGEPVHDAGDLRPRRAASRTGWSRSRHTDGRGRAVRLERPPRGRRIGILRRGAGPPRGLPARVARVRAERRRLRYFPRWPPRCPSCAGTSSTGGCSSIAAALLRPGAGRVRGGARAAVTAPAGGRRAVRADAPAGIAGFGAGARVAGADVAADLVGLASLVRGSIGYRSPVL